MRGKKKTQFKGLPWSSFVSIGTLIKKQSLDPVKGILFNHSICAVVNLYLIPTLSHLITNICELKKLFFSMNGSILLRCCNLL